MELSVPIVSDRVCEADRKMVSDNFAKLDPSNMDWGTCRGWQYILHNLLTQSVTMITH